jgi:hypothetical protein
MIKNKFVHELDLNLDLEELTNVAINSEIITGRPSHHRLVADNDYLSKLKNEFPFLSPVFNIYKFKQGVGLPVHVDSERMCALNIPICNADHADTVFYEQDDNGTIEVNSGPFIQPVKGNLKEAFRFKLSRPTLVNTKIPHSVLNDGTDTRIIISWSILKPMTFEECILCLQ